MILLPRAVSGAALLVALTFSSVSQAQIYQPLEKEDDPPAPLVLRREVSESRVVQFGRFTSYQVNVNSMGENIVGDAANEPSIAIHPGNSNVMTVGWRQFNSVTSNFRTGGWGYTTNGGTSWTFPGSLVPGQFRSDPVLNADAAGNFFYNSLITNFYTDEWRSTTGGTSWEYLGPAYGGDKQWFTIDTTNSGGRGFQYQIWSVAQNKYEGRQFTRSVDGGVTWMDPIYIPNAPCLGTLDVDTNGNVFVGGINFNTGQFWCVRSSDAKIAAVTPTFDQSTVVDIGGFLSGSQQINPVGLTGQLYLVIDRSGAATNNNIYMLASVLPSGAGAGSDVHFVRSTDGGATFSAPIRINNDPVNVQKWHWLATLSVAPNGRLDAVWLDSRNASNNTDSQLFYAYSFDGGQTWSPNTAVTPAFNPFVGYPNQQKMGDYMSVVSDNAAGHVAYCATFNGGQDIYYVRVAPIAPIPTSAVSRKTHGDAGPFDLPLPLTGSPASESRRGSGANFSTHQVVVTFANAVSVGGVSVTSADGLATASHSVDGPVVTVTVSDVADAQTLSVKLTNVNDGVGLGDVIIPMAVLLGDTNGDRAVNSGDATQTRARAGQVPDAKTFPSDVTAGGVINSGDVTVVRSRSGGSLP